MSRVEKTSLIEILPGTEIVTQESKVYHAVVRDQLFISLHDTSSGKRAIGYWNGSPEELRSARAFVSSFVGKREQKALIDVRLIGSERLLVEFQPMMGGDFKSVKKIGIESSGHRELYYFSESGRLSISLAADQKTTAVKKKVLVVDDSKTIRDLLSKVLSSDPGLEVVDCAESPSQAEEMIKLYQPDVITLDIHLPEMDGVTFLRKYLPKDPIPTVMISSISMEESHHVLSALEAGAVDYIQKPSLQEISRIAPLIIEKVKTAATVKPRVSVRRAQPKPGMHSLEIQEGMLIAIGSSTGGTEALKEVLTALPKRIPPIVCVQHIPPIFSKAFADRLNQLCPFEVKEAQDGDEVRANRVLIAPGGFQMSLRKSGSQYKVRIEDAPPVNRHKPSVDTLFDSVAELVGAHAIGIILTGMGADGAKGLLKMRNAGARTLAQDRDSCVVFGMPGEAIKLGAACEVHTLGDIAPALMKLARKRTAA